MKVVILLMIHLCNTLDDPSSRTYVPDETEYVNLNVFNMITRINYAKY